MKIENSQDFKLLSPAAQKRIREHPDERYRFLFLLGLEAGCRVTEAASIKWAQIFFSQKFIRIRSEKKRGAEKDVTFRDVPMTSVLYLAAVAWFEKSGRPDGHQFCFPAIMPSRTVSGHFSRFSVHSAVKKYLGVEYSYHDFRHTCLTHLATTSKDLVLTSRVAGHKSTATTEIYVHVAPHRIREAFQALENESWFKRLQKRLFPKKDVWVVPVDAGQFKYNVGRRKEIFNLCELMEKRVNIYLKAPAGMGKTHILDTLKDPRIIRITDFKSPHKILEQLILHLDSIGRKIRLTENREEILAKTITKAGLKTLADQAIWATGQGEFTLLFDDASQLTNSGAKLLESLRDHFHIIVAAREIAAEKSIFLSNFEKIELEPLSKAESRELIQRLSADLNLDSRTDDLNLLQNHVLNSTGGNPLFITQHMSRFGKDSWIPTRSITQIAHTAAKDQSRMDATPAIFVALMLLGLWKYIGREEDSEDRNAYLIFGAAALCFAFIIRALMMMQRDLKTKTA